MLESRYYWRDFHDLWLCGKDCPLAKSTYADKLFQAADSVARETNRRCYPRYVDGDVALVHSSLHRQSIFVERLVSDANDKLVIRDLFKMFASRLNDEEASDSITPSLELLLWCTVLTDKTDELELNLRTFKEIIPPCLLSALLLEAIQQAADSSALILLDAGASTTIHTPISVLGAKFWELSFREDMTEQEKDLTSKRLTRILKSLLEHGADPFVEIDGNFSLLNRCSAFAYCSEDASRMLIEAAPTKLLVTKQSNGAFDCCSAIAAAFFDAALISTTLLADDVMPGSSILLTSTEKVISRCILPLLRAGGNCLPDPLGSADFITTIVQLLFAKDEPSNLLRPWTETAVIARLMVVMSQCSPFHSARCEVVIEGLEEATTPEGLQWASDVLRKCQHQYPRPLQALARTSVLNCLPIGLRQRTAAIRQLQIPCCLKDYLNFCDIEL